MFCSFSGCGTSMTRFNRTEFPEGNPVRVRSNAITLRFPGSTEPLNYDVFIVTPGGQYQRIGNVVSRQSPQDVDFPVVPGRTYTYRVRSILSNFPGIGGPLSRPLEVEVPGKLAKFTHFCQQIIWYSEDSHRCTGLAYSTLIVLSKNGVCSVMGMLLLEYLWGSFCHHCFSLLALKHSTHSRQLPVSYFLNVACVYWNVTSFRSFPYGVDFAHLYFALVEVSCLFVPPWMDMCACFVFLLPPGIHAFSGTASSASTADTAANTSSS